MHLLVRKACRELWKDCCDRVDVPDFPVTEPVAWEKFGKHSKPCFVVHTHLSWSGAASESLPHFARILTPSRPDP